MYELCVFYNNILIIFFLIPSFEDKLRRTNIYLSARSLKTYLTFKVKVYSKCFDPLWYGVCNKLDMANSISEKSYRYVNNCPKGVLSRGLIS